MFFPPKHSPPSSFSLANCRGPRKKILSIYFPDPKWLWIAATAKVNKQGGKSRKIKENEGNMCKQGAQMIDGINTNKMPWHVSQGCGQEKQRTRAKGNNKKKRKTKQQTAAQENCGSEKRGKKGQRPESERSEPANAWAPNQNTILWECRQGKNTKRKIKRRKPKTRKKQNKNSDRKGKKQRQKHRRKPKPKHTHSPLSTPKSKTKKSLKHAFSNGKWWAELWCNFFLGVARPARGWGWLVVEKQRRWQRRRQRHNQNNKPQFTYTTPQSPSLRCRRTAGFSQCFYCGGYIFLRFPFL